MYFLIDATYSRYIDIYACVCTLYCGEFERSSVERLDPLGLHGNVSFLQAVFLQQVVHLQKMFPKVLREQLRLREKKEMERREIKKNGGMSKSHKTSVG